MSQSIQGGDFTDENKGRRPGKCMPSAMLLTSGGLTIDDDQSSSRQMPSDVVFDGQYGMNSSGDNSQLFLGSPQSNGTQAILDALQTKMRQLAREEAFALIQEEHQRRLNEQNQKNKLAKKLITKKQHQLLINEILPLRSITNNLQHLEVLEQDYRMELTGGLGGGLLEINTHIFNVVDTTTEEFDKEPVWTEQTEETEQLLELPHPVPVKPEISPSFIESNSHKDEEDDDVNYNEQQSQQVSPVPSKKPEKFSTQKMSSEKSTSAKKHMSQSPVNIRLRSSKKAIKDPSPTARIHRSEKVGSPAIDHQQSQSPQGARSERRLRQQQMTASSIQDEYFAVEHPTARSSKALAMLDDGKGSPSKMINLKLQEYMTGSKDASANKQRISVPELKGLSKISSQVVDSAKKSARSSNTVSRNNQGGGSCTHNFTTVVHTSRNSIGEKSDIGGGATARTASKQPEIKGDSQIAAVLSSISARTFQAFLSRRYQNFELAYLITLIAALYEDSIPMNGSQTDLVFKNNWDDISRQLFNAARIIRSLTKLKYSASSDPKSDFIRKLQKISFSRKFDQLNQRFDHSQLDQPADAALSRVDYQGAVLSLYSILACINSLLMKACQKNHYGSDFDGGSNSGNFLGDIEEKSDGNSINLRGGQQSQHRRTSSIPRQMKPSNRVQAVKIDLALPVGQSRQQQHGLSNFNSAQQPALTSRIVTGEEYFQEDKGKSSSFTNVLAQKISQYCSQKRQMQGGTQQQSTQQKGTSRNPVGGIDRSSLLEPSPTTDGVSFTKSPHHQSGKSITKTPTAQQKSGPTLNQKYQERLKRQALFQQSLTDYIVKESQSKKSRQEKAAAANQHGLRTTSSSFLKQKESTTQGTSSISSKVSASTNSQAKSFLKFVPGHPITTFHSPSMSGASVTFGNGQTQPLLFSPSSVKTVQQQTPSSSGIKPPTVMAHKLPPFNASNLAKQPSAFPAQISELKNMIQQPTPAASKAKKQATPLHEDKMKRHMAVLLKLTEPVRGAKGK